MKLFWGVVLVVLTANGVMAQDENLKGIKPCIGPSSVSLNIREPGGLDTNSLKNRLQEELEKRLTLSRIPFERGTCQFIFYIFVETTIAGSSGIRAYSIDAEIDDLLPTQYPRWVIIWSRGTYGFIARTGRDLEDYLFQEARDKIEAFALAWIKANP